MASMLSRVTRGKVKRPHCIVVYGPDGVGKTTFGSQAPKPIFLGPERGTSTMDIERLPVPYNFSDVMLATGELLSDPHPYQSVIVDSLDWMEPLVFAEVCLENKGAKSIELAAGGYGKGYKEALLKWATWRARLDDLRDKRDMNIILLAHAAITDFQDPQAQVAYHRYQLKLHKDAAAMFREWAECVLFVNHQTFATEEGRAIASGKRVAYTERGAGWDAKNRFDLPAEITLPKAGAWAAFEQAVAKAQPEKPDAVRKRIAELTEAVKDEATRKLVADTVAKAGDNAASLVAIEERVKKLVGNGPAAAADAKVQGVAS